MMTIKEFKEWFDAQFFVLLEGKITEFLSYSSSDTIRNIMTYLSTLAKGGKRFRPYMMYVGYVAEGGEEELFPLYAAMELLHLFCLVHDDVMDNESVRHNALTMHRHIETMYGMPELGRSVAILVGDALLAWAYECLKSVEEIEPYTIDDAAAQFRIMLTEVIHGQLLDVLSIAQPNQSREMIERKMMLKSARYSFFQPLYIGMLAAGADEETKDFAEEYAVSLGMAFQLQDDSADYASDIEEGQQTLLTWYMRNEAPMIDQASFESYIGKAWSDEDERTLTRLLQDSGALAFAETQAEEYFLRAEDAIFNHDRTGEEIWQEIIAEVKRPL